MRTCAVGSGGREEYAGGPSPEEFASRAGEVASRAKEAGCQRAKKSLKARIGQADNNDAKALVAAEEADKIPKARPPCVRKATRHSRRRRSTKDSKVGIRQAELNSEDDTNDVHKVLTAKR